MGTAKPSRKKQRKYNKRSNIQLKKYTKGEAVRFITRSAAMRKLQVSLRSFRRLCILKGIYPVQPQNIKQANKGNPTKTTFYLLKDVKFLQNEPLLQKFHEQRIFVKRIKKAVGRREYSQAEELDDRFPKVKLDHLVFERYPSFEMALNDADDALCAIFLFATYPPNETISAKLVHMCQRLAAEFFNYVIYSRSLRKVFISIKGYYYEAEIFGQKIVWLQPHQFTQPVPRLVDFRVMRTFLDFYVYLVGFINFRLFNSINLVYPPKLTKSDKELETEYLIAFNSHLCKLAEVQNTEEVELDLFEDTNEAIKQQNEEIEELNTFKKLFEGCKFFISREVPREQFAFVIRSFGGEVSWSETQGLGSTFPESDTKITHQIVDRNTVSDRKLTRFYIQPQWVFDCVNARSLIPMEPYFPGKTLPPHVSPFTADASRNATSYIPVESQLLARKKAAEDLKNPDNAKEESSDEGVSSEDEDDENEVPTKHGKKEVKSASSAIKKKPVTPGKKVENKKADFPETHDEELLAKQLPKRRRYYYNASKRREQSIVDKADNLEKKRKIVDDVKRLSRKAAASK
ncbi:pescadillo homolog [Symsagittifera roscoffensis]|uniref:pescadillo homolog n=1 Tax=Symsagittifera roscoffensis TaxID=84072 RepID=UPI00307B17C7